MRTYTFISKSASLLEVSKPRPRVLVEATHRRHTRTSRFAKTPHFALGHKSGISFLWHCEEAGSHAIIIMVLRKVSNYNVMCKTVIVICIIQASVFVLQDGRQRNDHPNQPCFRDFSPRKCSWLGLLRWLCDVTWIWSRRGQWGGKGVFLRRMEL